MTVRGTVASGRVFDMGSSFTGGTGLCPGVRHYALLSTVSTQQTLNMTEKLLTGSSNKQTMTVSQNPKRI